MSLINNRIIGIDPGTNILGYGIIEIKDHRAILLDCNILNLKKLNEQQIKLREIFLRVQDIIEAYRPAKMAIELPFYAKNPQSMLKLGRAQGVAIAAAIVMGVEIAEYSAKKIKQSITGNGNASKQQVCAMLSALLETQIEIDHFDATDALAAAMCLHFQSTSPIRGISKSLNWKKYIEQHPHRVRR